MYQKRAVKYKYEAKKGILIRLSVRVLNWTNNWFFLTICFYLVNIRR